MSKNIKQQDGCPDEPIELKLPGQEQNSTELQDSTIQNTFQIQKDQGETNFSQEKSKIDLESQNPSNLNDINTNIFIKELINDIKNDDKVINIVNFGNLNLILKSSQTSNTKILTYVNSVNKIQNRGNSPEFKTVDYQNLNQDQEVNHPVEELQNIDQNLIQLRKENAINSFFEQNFQANELVNQNNIVYFKNNENINLQFENTFQGHKLSTGNNISSRSQQKNHQDVQKLKSNIIEVNIVSQKKKLQQDQQNAQKNQNNLQIQKTETLDMKEMKQIQPLKNQNLVKQKKATETSKNKVINLSNFSIDGISGSNIVLQPLINTKSNKNNKFSKIELQKNISNIQMNKRDQLESKSSQKKLDDFKNSNSDGEINKQSSQKLNFRLYADSSKNKNSRFSLKKQQSNRLTNDDHIGLSNSKYYNSFEKSNSSQINVQIQSLQERQFSKTLKIEQPNQNLKFQTISPINHNLEERDSVHSEEKYFLQNRDKFQHINKTSMKIKKILQHESIIRKALEKRNLEDDQKNVLNQDLSQIEAEQILYSISLLQKENKKKGKQIQLDDLISDTNSIQKQDVSNSMKKIALVQSQLSSYLDNYQSHLGANYLQNIQMSPAYSVSPQQQQNYDSPSKNEYLSGADANQFLSLYNSQPIYHQEQTKQNKSKEDIIDSFKQKIQYKASPKGLNNIKKYQNSFGQVVGEGKKQQRQENQKKKIFPYVFQYQQNQQIQNPNKFQDQVGNNALSNSFQLQNLNNIQNSRLPQFKKNSLLNKSLQESVKEDISKKSRNQNFENIDDKLTIKINQSFGGSLNSPNLIPSLIVQPINLQENDSPISKKFNNIEIEDGLINLENSQLMTERYTQNQTIQTLVQWNDMDEQSQIQILQILQYLEKVTSNQQSQQEVNHFELEDLRAIISQVQGIPGYLSLKRINNAVMTPLVSSQKQSLRIKRMKQVQLEKQKRKLELINQIQSFKNSSLDNKSNQSNKNDYGLSNYVQIEGNSFSLSNFKQGIVNELIKMNVFDSSRWMPTGLLIHPLPQKKNKIKSKEDQLEIMDNQNVSIEKKEDENNYVCNEQIYQEDQNQQRDHGSKFMAPANFKVAIKQRTLNNLSSSMEQKLAQKESHNDNKKHNDNINFQLQRIIQNTDSNYENDLKFKGTKDIQNKPSFKAKRSIENENQKFGVKLPQNKTNSQIKGIDNIFSLKTLVKIEEENEKTQKYQKGAINVQKAVINKVNFQQLRNQIALMQNDLGSNISQIQNRKGYISERSRKGNQLIQQFQKNNNTVSSTVEALMSNQITAKDSKDQIQANSNYILRNNEISQFGQIFQRDSSELVKSRNQEEGLYNFKVLQKEKTIDLNKNQITENQMQTTKLNFLSHEQSPKDSVEIQAQINNQQEIYISQNIQNGAIKVYQQNVQSEKDVYNFAKNSIIGDKKREIEPIEEEETLTKSRNFIQKQLQNFEYEYIIKLPNNQQNTRIFNIQEHENENSQNGQSKLLKDENMDFTFKNNEYQNTPMFILNQSSQKSLKYQHSYQRKESQNSDNINNNDYKEKNIIKEHKLLTPTIEASQNIKMGNDFNSLISKRSINIVNIKKGITTASQNSESLLRRSRMSSNGNLNMSAHDRSLRKSKILANAKSSKIGNQDISQILNDSKQQIIEKRVKNTQTKVGEEINRNSSGLISDKYNQEEDRIQSALLIGSPVQNYRLQGKSSQKLACFNLKVNPQFKLDSNQIQKEVDSQLSFKGDINLENKGIKNKNQMKTNLIQLQPFSAFKTSQIGENNNENYIQYNLIDYMAATNIEQFNQNTKQLKQQPANLDTKSFQKINLKVKSSLKNSSDNSIDIKVSQKVKNTIQAKQISVNQNKNQDEQKRQSSPSFGRQSPHVQQIIKYQDDQIDQIYQGLNAKRNSPQQRKIQYATKENAEKMKDLLIQNIKEEIKIKDPNKRRNTTIETFQSLKQKKKSFDEQNKLSTKSQNKKQNINNDLKLKYSIVGMDDQIGVFNIPQTQKGDQSLNSDDNYQNSQSISTTPINNFSLLTPRKNSVYLTSSFLQTQNNSQTANVNFNFKPPQILNYNFQLKKFGDKKNTLQADSTILEKHIQSKDYQKSSNIEIFQHQNNQNIKQQEFSQINESFMLSFQKPPNKQDLASQASTFTFETSLRNTQNKQFQNLNIKQKQPAHLRNMKIQNEGFLNNGLIQSQRDERDIYEIKIKQNQIEIEIDNKQAQYGYDDYCSSQADENVNLRNDNDSKRGKQLINQLLLPEVYIKNKTQTNIQQSNYHNQTQNNYQDSEELYYRMHLKTLNNQLLREKLHFQRLITQNTIHKNFELRFKNEKRNLQSKSLAANKQQGDISMDEHILKNISNDQKQSMMLKTMVVKDLSMKKSKVSQISNYLKDEKRPFSIVDRKLNTIQNTMRKENQGSTTSRPYAAHTPVVFMSQKTNLVQPNDQLFNSNDQNINQNSVQRNSDDQTDHQQNFDQLLNIQMNQSSYRSKFDLNQTQNSVQFKQIKKLQEGAFKKLEKFQGITQRIDRQQESLFDLQDGNDSGIARKAPHYLRQLSNQRGENVGFVKKNENANYFNLNKDRKNKIKKTIEQIGDYFCSTQNSISNNLKY